MTAMLRIDDLHVSYGRINAVQGLTLESVRKRF